MIMDDGGMGGGYSTDSRTWNMIEYEFRMMFSKQSSIGSGIEVANMELFQPPDVGPNG